MSWRLANSLVTLRNQVNAMYPNRNKASDGTIGDTAHQSEGSASDHNPWLPGEVVSALDLTHDPANGLDIDKFSDVLAASGDNRIKYIIANSQIWQPNTGWQPYYGSNPHDKHVHISVNTSNYDDGRLWNLKESEDEMVGTAEQVYVAFNNARMRPPSEAEINQFVGKWKLTDLNTALSQGKEREAVEYMYQVGQLSLKDDHMGQIRELHKKLDGGQKVTQEEIDALAKMADNLEQSIKKANQ